MKTTETASASRAVASLLVAATLALGACATGPNANPRDPLEPFNRQVSKFNDSVDTAVLRPVATAYRDGVPQLVRTGVSNFFGNLGDAWSAVNSLLQFKLQYAAENWMRFTFNTVFGFVGVLDIASDMKIERHREDFGQTLGRWGVPTGPYIVLPFFGPSTLRDTAALPVDWRGDLVYHIDPVDVRNGFYGLRVVNTRAALLRAGDVLEGAALDKYSFVRDAYLQRRQAEVNDFAPRDDRDGNDGAGGSDDEGGQIPPEPAPAR